MMQRVLPAFDYANRGHCFSNCARLDCEQRIEEQSRIPADALLRNHLLTYQLMSPNAAGNVALSLVDDEPGLYHNMALLLQVISRSESCL